VSASASDASGDGDAPARARDNWWRRDDDDDDVDASTRATPSLATRERREERCATRCAVDARGHARVDDMVGRSKTRGGLTHRSTLGVDSIRDDG